MSKHVVVLMLSLFFNSVALAQSRVARYDDGEQFRGPVKSVRVEVVVVSRQGDELIESPRILKYIKNYSPDRRRCEDTYYKLDGSLHSRVVFLYNNAGKLLEKSHYHDNDILNHKQVNTFDNGGRIIAETTYDGDGMVLQKRFLIYSNAKDRLLEIYTYDEKGMLLRKDVNAPDYQNKKSVWLTEYINGDHGKQTFDLKYPEPRLQENIHYFSGGEVSKTVSSDESPVRRLETGDFNTDGSNIRTVSQTREYDSHKNTTKVTYLKLNKQSGVFEPYNIIHYVITYY